MIIPFKPSEIFERNPKAKTSVDGDVVIIDDYYLHYEDIYDMLMNTYAPMWKADKEHSRNFIDYYDCRPCISIAHADIKYEFDIIAEVYHEQGRIEKLGSNLKEYNYFKWKENISPQTHQMYPHRDTQYASIIYMDKVCSGGTAFYEGITGHFENNEGRDLFYDVSTMIKKVIPAKPNRHIIFRGDKFHGGYIEDHNKYVNDWRINECIFYKSVGEN